MSNGAAAILGFARRSVWCECASDPAIVAEAGHGVEGSGLFDLLKAAHRRKIIFVERFGERFHHAAAALAEVGPQRPVAELRVAAAGGEHGARRRDRLIFQTAAADGAEKSAVRLQHNAGARLARHRSGGTDHADQRRQPRAARSFA